MSATGTAISIEVATAGATYPITIDPIIAEDQRVQTSAAGDRIGEVVAADGNTVAVAARLNDDLGVDVGAVHVDVDPGDGCVLQHTEAGGSTVGPSVVMSPRCVVEPSWLAPCCSRRRSPESRSIRHRRWRGCW